MSDHPGMILAEKLSAADKRAIKAQATEVQRINTIRNRAGVTMREATLINDFLKTKGKRK